MSKKNLSLRKFINKTALGITGTALSTMAGFSVITSVAAMSASSYKRIMGANDRINIAFLGCGWRSHGHQNMVKMSVKNKNLGVVAVCDLRNHNREKTAARCKEMFGNEVRQFMYSEDLPNMKNRNAVMIATGDFQHAKILAEVVRAGKDCYCEKPMAQDIAEAKMVREAVLTSKQIVQNGSQWLSDPMQIKVRDIVPSGKLGQITKIEQAWNDNNHRWHDPKDPDVTAIREKDTDWKRWLLGKPYCPFDPWAYFEFRIFRRVLRRNHIPMDEPCLRTGAFYTDTKILIQW